MTTLVKKPGQTFVKGYTETVTECRVIPGTPPKPAYCTKTGQFSSLTIFFAYINDENGLPIAFSSFVQTFPPTLAQMGFPPNEMQPGWTFNWLIDGYIETFEQVLTCFPESSGTPDQTVCDTFTRTIPDHYELGSNAGWNAGARLIDDLPGEGYYEFEVPHSTNGAATGLSKRSNPLGFTDPYNITYGFIIKNGKYGFITNHNIGNPFIDYTDGVKFKVRRIGGYVEWYVDDIRVKSLQLSGLAKTQPLIIQGSLFAANDQIDQARRVIESSTEAFVDAEFGVVGEFSDAGLGAAVVPIVKSSPKDTGSGGTVFAVVGEFSNIAELIPFIDASFGFEADFNGSPYVSSIDNEFGFIAEFGDRITGQARPRFGASGRFDALVEFINGVTEFHGEIGTRGFGFAVPGEVGDGVGEFGTQAAFADSNWGVGAPLFGLQAGFFSVYGALPIAVDGEIPVPGFMVESALGAETGSSEIYIPCFTVEADFFADSEIPIPGFTIEATLSLSVLFTGEVPIPGFEPESEILAGAAIDSEIFIPGLEVEADFGIDAEIAIPGIQVESDVLTGTATSSEIHIPLFIVESTLNNPVDISAEIFIPGFTGPDLDQTDEWDLEIFIPGFTVESDFTETVADSGYAYAVNLDNGAVSRWTGYPVLQSRIHRFQGRALTLVAGNLIEITGNTDNGADIPVVGRLHPYRPESGYRVRPWDLVFGVRETNGVKAALVLDENVRSKEYKKAANPKGEGLHNVSVDLAHGLRESSYLEVEFANVDGGRLDIDEITLTVDQTSRET